MNHTVTIYSTPSCPYCVYAKNFFTENNVSFVDKNVAQDQNSAREMVQKSNQMGVPVIDIDGTVVVGYQPDVFSKLLGI